MGNPVTRWQIVTEDTEGAARFYEKMFGWNIDPADALNYRTVDTRSDGKGVAGGIWPSPPAGRAFVQLFVEVDDVDAALQKATELGATIVVPKTALPDGDQMAIIHDGFGLSFGLWRRVTP